MSATDLKELLEKSADKLSVFSSDEVLGKYSVLSISNAINSLDDEIKIKILSDKELITKKINLSEDYITDLIKNLPSDEIKLKMIQHYSLQRWNEIKVLKSFSSDKTKLDILLKKENNFSSQNIAELLGSLNCETLISFLYERKDWLSQKNIRPYNIVHFANSKVKEDFMKHFNDIELTDIEKMEILATLPQTLKSKIDTSSFPEKYKIALSMPVSSGRITVDFDGNLELYRGLDNLIAINPDKLTEEQHSKFMKLCEICPNLGVVNTLYGLEYFSTPSEYKDATEWITSLINSLKPEYSTVQKIAVIDNAIGKKISYSPDIDTEAYSSENSRALYKIVSSGYGICNGIANLEKYIFDKIGIESERVGTANHSFLKLTNIEIPLANGEVVKGTTLLDPTWNLSAHRFNGKPNNFLVSYDEIRKHDIDSNGVDHNCHKNDDKLQDATFNLDDKSLRSIFTSVGLADKDGIFPIKYLIDKSEAIHQLYANDPQKNINSQFALLASVYPEFAKCQNSTMEILSNLLLKNENLAFDKCIVNRVYRKNDNNRKPILYVYISSDELGKKFFFADENACSLVELSPEEFTNTFECYDKDLEKNKRNETLGTY